MQYKLRFRLIVYGTMVLSLVLFFSKKQLPEVYRHYATLTGILLFFCTLTLWMFMDFDKEKDQGNWLSTPLPQRKKRGYEPDAGPVALPTPQLRRRYLIEAYRSDASFRKIIWLHFSLMAAGMLWTIPYSKITFADPRAWLGVPGILLFFGAWVTLIVRMDRYLKRGRPDEYAHIPTAFRRLKTLTTYATLISLPLFGHFGGLYTQNLLSEIVFFCLFIPLSGVLAFVVARFLPARIPGMPEGMFRLEFQLVIWALFFLIFLAGTGAVNCFLAPEKSRTEALWVVKKRENHRKKQTLLLEVNGKARKFRPTRQEWENIREQDSLTVVIRQGALGFDFIEKFGVK